MNWIPLKFKIKNLLYECIVTTHKADHSTFYSVQYDLIFQGKLVKVLSSEDFVEQKTIVNRICELVPSITEDEAIKIRNQRELKGLI